MGALNSSILCGGDEENQRQKEMNQNEVYLPSSYYPYHINHLQNSEYHPRTYHNQYNLDTEQADYNTQMGYQQYSSSSSKLYNPQNNQYNNNNINSNNQEFRYQSNHHPIPLQQSNQQQQYMKNPINNSIENSKRMKDQYNGDLTVLDIYGSNRQDQFYNGNINNQNNNLNSNSKYTYTTPFHSSLSQNKNQPNSFNQNIIDSEQLKQQQKSYQDRINKLAEIVSFSPVLRLTITASANLKKDHVLTINAQGLLNGIRNERDGYVFFGCKKKAKRVNKLIKQTQIINDFIIPPTDPQQAKQQRGRHFQIRYDLKNNFYTVVDLGVGFGAFKKLTIPHILRNHDLINFGLTLCTIKFVSKQNPNKSFAQKTFQNKEDIILKAQFFGGYSNGETYELDPKEYQEITIGRSENCSLTFKDKLISKVQCLLTFNNNYGWILKDGDGSLPSTNGTWIYLQKEEQITDGMIIKANQTVFQASIL